MTHPDRQFPCFGEFRLDIANRLVLRNDEPLALTPRAVATLIALVEHRGEIVAKDELMRTVWPDTIVEEANLTQQIYLLRRALGDGVIETMPRRGYRFAGELNDEAAAPTAHRRWTWLLAAAAAMTIIWATVVHGPPAPATNGPIHSIAVLPLQPLGPNAGDEAIGIALANALITRLSNVRTLIVRPTSDIIRYASGRSLSAAGKELKVDALLDGRFQRANGRLRVTVQLIRVADGEPLWADQFDEPFTDLLVVQERVARRVADVISLKLSLRAQRLLVKRFTENQEAYRQYLRGRALWSHRTPADVREAIRAFERALRHDPDYALAYAGMAQAYVLLARSYDSGEQEQATALPRARAAAMSALSLDDTLADAHTALAVVQERYEGDDTGAETEFRRALELDPNDAYAHHLYSLHLSAIGRTSEAMAEMRLAEKLDPLSFSISRGVGDIALQAGNYEAALKQYARTLRMAPNDPMAASLHATVGWVHEFAGDHDAAANELLASARLRRAAPETLAALRRAYARGGLVDYWREWLALKKDDVTRGRVSPFELAQIHAFLGENARAFAYLRKADDDRSIPLSALRSSPQFAALRGDPRYAGWFAARGTLR